MWFKNIFFIFLLFLNSVGWSKILNIPKNFNPEKIHNGFDYYHSQKSSLNQKIDFKVSLHPSGELDYKSLYFSNNKTFCSSEGGRLLKKLSLEERVKFLSMAIKANNQSKESILENPHFYSSLLIEFGEDIYNLKIDSTQKSMINFQNTLFKELDQIYRTRKFFLEALSIIVKKTKKQLVYEIKNIGKRKAQIFFSTQNQSQFFFRKSSGELIFLKYKKMPRKSSKVILPGQSIQVEFFLPDNANNVVFYYDNTGIIFDENLKQQKSHPAVHLCFG